MDRIPQIIRKFPKNATVLIRISKASQDLFEFGKPVIKSLSSTWFSYWVIVCSLDVIFVQMSAQFVRNYINYTFLLQYV